MEKVPTLIKICAKERKKKVWAEVEVKLLPGERLGARRDWTSGYNSNNDTVYIRWRK